MITYFDTSAIVPLLLAEPGSRLARELWRASDRVVSVRLAYPEGRAALAHANRLQRLTAADLRRAVAGLDELIDEIDVVELDHRIARRAGVLAEEHELRGYDAVHLAAAERIADDGVVVVAGDRALLEAAAARGLATAETA